MSNQTENTNLDNKSTVQEVNQEVNQESTPNNASVINEDKIKQVVKAVLGKEADLKDKQGTVDKNLDIQYTCIKINTMLSDFVPQFKDNYEKAVQLINEDNSYDNPFLKEADKTKAYLTFAKEELKKYASQVDKPKIDSLLSHKNISLEDLKQYEEICSRAIERKKELDYHKMKTDSHNLGVKNSYSEAVKKNSIKYVWGAQ